MYIGPLRNPDFATDYHISPVLAPSELLAQFPPLLMQCGEKDPFVDDTIIFAGRVREAKRQRLAELDKQFSGRSQFGEKLRMTRDSLEEEKLAALRQEREKLGKETEEDWVEMCIFSDWSHGYLQMPMLMTEAKEAINDLADWIDDRFAVLPSSAQSSGVQGSVAIPSFFADSHSSDDSGDDMEPDEHITFSSKRRSSSGTMLSTSPSDVSPRVTNAAERDVPESPPLASRQSQQSPAGNAGGKSKGRLTGQTITESEVMRRRRLLDSHVFTEK